MEYELGLDQKKRYLIGASGGSDSMTLLSLCLEQGYHVVVAHVNYKLRANADKEERLLKDYCNKHGVKVYTLYPKQQNHDNFQSWAREARYQFYKEIYEMEKLDGLLLGHQLDDHIESYLMAKERGSHGWYYGIRKESELYGMKVYRPLLALRKRETRQYCLEHQVPFGDDESNFTDKYTRNRIRHQLVEKATEEQISSWINEIEQLNQQLKEKIEYIDQCFPADQDISIAQFNQQQPKLKGLIIRRYFFVNGFLKPLSADFVNEIVQRLNHQADKNGLIDIDEDYVFVYEYGIFYICKRKRDFYYVLNSVEWMENEFFTLKEVGKTIEGLTLSKEDFPIVIRNYMASDTIHLRLGHKKVSRFLIDRKILYRDRICWPVIENAAKEVVFVHNIGCDVYHFSIKPSLFMVK